MIQRYSLPEMSEIWEDDFKFKTWLQIELLACEARVKLGQIPESDFNEIKSRAKFNVNEINEIEKQTKHDVIAFLTNVANYVGPASRHIHYGMTSSDVLDTTLSFQMKNAGEILHTKLLQLKDALKEKALKYKYTPCIGRSHGVHAEAITLGFKFAVWYEEIKRDIKRLLDAMDVISVGQISGAVGTFEHLSPTVEEFICINMGLKPAGISTQILQRDRHAQFLSTLAIIGCSIEKIAVEIRHLQRTEVLELEEYFSAGQKGSSAMPHKRNPIISERLTGLARLLRSNSIAALENVALWHERDISHSSVERIIIPDSCLALDYMLYQATALIANLIVYPENMQQNLNLTRGLIYSQSVLLALVQKGLTREAAYKIVQDNAMKVWKDKSTNLYDELLNSQEVAKYITANELKEIFNSSKMLRNIDFIFARTVEKD